MLNDREGELFPRMENKSGKIFRYLICNTYKHMPTCFRNMCLETLFAYSQASHSKSNETNEPFSLSLLHFFSQKCAYSERDKMSFIMANLLAA